MGHRDTRMILYGAIVYSEERRVVPAALKISAYMERSGFRSGADYVFMEDINSSHLGKCVKDFFLVSDGVILKIPSGWRVASGILGGYYNIHSFFRKNLDALHLDLMERVRSESYVASLRGSKTATAGDVLGV